ncbi:MAG: phosphate acetyltransferase [Alphaproteobacteria bacterium]|nr:phosphate acetyltransferase [Alphaproteobacteria bacterium]
MKGVFFIAGESETNKSEIAELALEKMRAKGKKVAYFKPIGIEHDVLFPLPTAKKMVVEEKTDALIETIIENYKKIEAENDFVIVEGTNMMTRDTVVDFRLNLLVAKHLCLPVVLIMREDRDTLEASDFISRILKQNQVSVLGMLSSEKGLDYLLDESEKMDKPILSTKMFEWQLVDKAKSNKQRIVLPEGECERVLRSADDLNRRQIASLTILGKKDEISAKAKELGLSLEGVDIIDPETSAKFEDYAATLAELRKAKGMTIDEARNLMKDGAYFGTMMVYKGEADGMVSGAEHTTANTIRPALQFIKTKPNTSLVSGVFLMCLLGKLSVFADCAVTPNPTSEQLSEIAVTTAETARLFGLEPKVAFLSYGTGESGKGPDVDLVKEAVRITKEKGVDFAFEGPIQFDAAVDPGVAKTKLPNSDVAGQANVFIFPDLNTGNCCYKAIQRSLGDECLAVGPILQGLNKPVNDLSRGATVPDIINTVAVTALFAQKER